MRTFPNWAHALEAVGYPLVAGLLVWWLTQVWVVPAHAQPITITGVPSYLEDVPNQAGRLDLAMPNGRYLVELGDGCDGIGAGVEVYWLAGSHNAGALLPVAAPGVVCNAYIAGLVDPTPCALGADGFCDVNAEPAN